MAAFVGDAYRRVRRDSIDIDSGTNAAPGHRGDGLNGYRRPSFDSGGGAVTGATFSVTFAVAVSYTDSADTGPHRHLPIAWRLGDRRSRKAGIHVEPAHCTQPEGD